MTKRTLWTVIGACALPFVGIPVACSAPGEVPRSAVSSSGGGSGGTNGTIDLDSGTTDPDLIMMQPPTPNCGDGNLDADEACDDFNQASEDGCGGNCRYIEQGYVCPDPGQPCRPFAKCADGILVFPEQCDDGALLGTDGCSENCKVEIGFKC